MTIRRAVAVSMVVAGATLWGCSSRDDGGSGGAATTTATASSTKASASSGGDPDAGVLCDVTPKCTTAGMGGAGGSGSGGASDADAGSDGGVDATTCDPVSGAPCDVPDGESCDWSAAKKSFICYPGPNNVGGGCAMCDETTGPFCSAGFTCFGVTKCAAFCCSDDDCATPGDAGATAATCKHVFGAASGVGVCVE